MFKYKSLLLSSVASCLSSTRTQIGKRYNIMSLTNHTNLFSHLMKFNNSSSTIVRSLRASLYQPTDSLPGQFPSHLFNSNSNCRQRTILPISQYVGMQMKSARFLHSYQDPIDPNKEPRRLLLIVATYISCFIGAIILSAVGMRQYKKVSKAAVGMEEVKIREYGRKPFLYKYRGYMFTDLVLNDVKNIHTFEVRDDDIWVVTFPKAGTTWLQEIVYLIWNDLDFEKASKVNVDDRFPYFEFPYPGKEVITARPSPRLIKSHLPLSLLPNQMKEKKPKIIYLARNPKDTVVSFHHFMVKFLKIVGTFTGTFDDYCRLFAEGKVIYGPWWMHVLEAWNRRDEENILFLWYEDMKGDLKTVIHQLSEFLGKPMTEQQVQALMEHVRFEKMRENKTLTYDWLRDQGAATQDKDIIFFRKGEVGDWQNHLSKEISDMFDQLIQDKLAPSGMVIKETLPAGKREHLRSKM